MKSSVIITNYRTDVEMRPYLYRCMESFWNKADEVLVISSKKSSLGEKINQGCSMAKGEYVIITNDDIELLTDLDDLFVEGTVTSPRLNGTTHGFHAHIFCVPKAVFKLVNGYSEEYENAYFDDDDFLKRCGQHDIPIKQIETVDVKHPTGGFTLNTIKGDFYSTNEQKFKERWEKK